MTVQLLNEQAIFEEARKAESPEARQAILDQKCGQDDELKRRLVALLCASEESESFLESPPPGLGTSPFGSAESKTTERPITEQPGTVIGPYKLLQQIGEGGMGVVFMAEQTEPIQRTVALKIIKPGMDTRHVIARFEAERQALAMMDHPNIAKVLDAGTTDTGRPYFVMDLVKGVPITKYCDEKQLSLRERLDLFMQVCQAIQHAHQKGIIHRDIKPTNVIVAKYDNHAVPKVIDFGVAKATAQKLTERTMFTEFGQVIGTVEYMSPEQAKLNQLDIDTRSDIYSLGVLLYELLAGSTPFEQKRLREAAFDEVLRIIREEEPPKPSTKLSSSDTLPSIAANRHTEPARLSKDLCGELDWIVMKCLEKDRTRRYESASSLAADIEHHLQDEPVKACPPSAAYRLRKFVRRNKAPLAALAAVALALVLGLIISAAGFVQANRQRKLAQENEARARIEAAKATAASDFLEEMLSSANPDSSKGAAYTVRQLLEESSRRLRDQFSGEPEVEAAVRAAIGNAYRRLDLMEKADPHLRRALEIRRSLFASGQGSEAQVAHSLLDYGWNLYEWNRVAEAERHLREALSIYKRNGLRDSKLVEIYATLQLCLNGPTRFAEAEVVANEALLIGRELFPQGHAELANILHRLADGKRAQYKSAEGEPLAREALAMHERWHGSNHPETGWSLLILAQICMDQGKLDEAERLYKRALSIFRTYYDDSHNSVAVIRAHLASIYTKRGDQAALDQLRAESAIQIANPLDRGADAASLNMALANTRRDRGEWDAAIHTYSLVIAINPDIAEAWSGRGECYLQHHQFAKAADDFTAAIERKPELSKAWTGRAFTYFDRQQWEQAVADFTKAIELAPKVHTNWLHRGHAYLQLAQWDKAVANFSKLVEQWPQDYWGWFFLAGAHAQLNQPSEALSDLRQAIANGFNDVEYLKTYPMFDTIRSHPDFERLVAELEGKKK